MSSLQFLSKCVSVSPQISGFKKFITLVRAVLLEAVHPLMFQFKIEMLSLHDWGVTYASQTAPA